jgi:CRISPR/Cas system-associated exonuclease Cas4 (RecB family)
VSSPPGWASASDLAEYAYCPRALYYRTRSPDAPETPDAEGGRRYHERVLRAERRRAEHPAAYWAGVLVGILLVVVGVAGGLRP